MYIKNRTLCQPMRESTGNAGIIEMFYRNYRNAGYKALPC
jgi:hypothetical protein